MELTAATVRLLVAHESAATRGEVCALAQAAGFRADEAGSLVELSRWLEQLPPAATACVLAPSRLPDGDAGSILAACEAATARPPLVLLRGQEDPDELLAAWSAGAAGLLPRRPFSHQALQAAVLRAAGSVGPATQSCAGVDGAQPLRVMQSTCHDLRNPLSAMMINANILLREETVADERRIKIANRILASATRMNRMIEDLADYAIAAQGKGISVRPTETDLGAIASEAMREVRAAHPGRNLVLEQHGDLHGHWDPGRLRQVMHTLLGAALKRGRPGAVVVVGCAEILMPPQVEIDLDYRLDQGGNGTGAMVDGDAGPAPDGEDASLFVAARIAHAHHGSLTVSSADGIGPRVVVRLPKRALVVPAALPAPPPA